MLWINVTFICNNCIFVKFFSELKYKWFDKKVCFLVFFKFLSLRDCYLNVKQSSSTSIMTTDVDCSINSKNTTENMKTQKFCHIEREKNV